MYETFVLDRILVLTYSLTWKKKVSKNLNFLSNFPRNHITNVSPSETELVAPTGKAKYSQTQVQQDS